MGDGKAESGDIIRGSMKRSRRNSIEPGARDGREIERPGLILNGVANSIVVPLRDAHRGCLFFRFVSHRLPECQVKQGSGVRDVFAEHKNRVSHFNVVQGRGACRAFPEDVDDEGDQRVLLSRHA